MNSINALEKGAVYSMILTQLPDRQAARHYSASATVRRLVKSTSEHKNRSGL